MFRVILGVERNKIRPLTFTIEDCPRSGLEAVDFHRQHYLPEGTNNQIILPGFGFTSEALVRDLYNHANNECDILLEHCQVPYWRCNAVGGVYQGGYLRQGGFSVRPEIIRTYLERQDEVTGELLLREILHYEARSKQQAEQEAAEYSAATQRKQEAIANARLLLQGEIDDLTRKLAAAEEEVSKWRKKAEAAENNDDDDDDGY